MGALLQLELVEDEGTGAEHVVGAEDTELVVVLELLADLRVEHAVELVRHVTQPSDLRRVHGDREVGAVDVVDVLDVLVNERMPEERRIRCAVGALAAALAFDVPADIVHCQGAAVGGRLVVVVHVVADREQVGHLIRLLGQAPRDLAGNHEVVHVRELEEVVVGVAGGVGDAAVKLSVEVERGAADARVLAEEAAVGGAHSGCGGFGCFGFSLGGGGLRRFGLGLGGGGFSCRRFGGGSGLGGGGLGGGRSGVIVIVVVAAAHGYECASADGACC